MELTSKQRAQLRGLANSIDTILQIGKDGIGENLIKQADDDIRGLSVFDLPDDAPVIAGAREALTKLQIL